MLKGRLRQIVRGLVKRVQTKMLEEGKLTESNKAIFFIEVNAKTKFVPEIIPLK
jgi:hypothetical protein